MNTNLLWYLANNLPQLLETAFVCPDTGKQKRLKDVGGSVYLRILIQICNHAGNDEREFYAGTARLATYASTTANKAEYWLRVYEALGWITPNGVRPPETGHRGRPAKCWLVTLPGLPPLVNRDFWQQPTPAPTAAPVVPIANQKQKRSSRSGVTVSLGSVVGNLAAQPQPQPEAEQPQHQPRAGFSDDTKQVAAEALAMVRTQYEKQGHTGKAAEMELLKLEGSFDAVYGKRQSPLAQVDAALLANKCSRSEAVKWLASASFRQTDLLPFVGEG